MDFIIEDGVLKAYVGPDTVEELRIPDGVIVIGSRFLQSQLRNVKVVIPASVEKIEEHAFDRCACRELVFEDEENSELREMYDYPEGVPFIKIPDFCSEFGIAKDQELSYDFGNFINNTVLVLPAYVASITTFKNVRHLFVEEKLYDNEFAEYKGAHYVYEGFEHASIKHVDKMQTEGVRYIATNKGAIIIDFDNNIAKWQDFPEYIDGMKVLAVNVLSPQIDHPNNRTDLGGDYGNEIDSYSNSTEIDKVKQKAGSLYPKLRYKAVSERKKLDDLALEFNSANKVEDVLGPGRAAPLDYDLLSEESQKSDKWEKLSVSLGVGALHKVKNFLFWVGLLTMIIFGSMLIATNANTPSAIEASKNFAFPQEALIAIVAVGAAMIIAGIVLMCLTKKADTEAAYWKELARKKYAEEQEKIKAEELAQGKVEDEEPDLPHCIFMERVINTLPVGYKAIAVKILECAIQKRLSDAAEAEYWKYRADQATKDLENAVRRSVSGGRETYTLRDKDGNNIGTIEKK